MLQTVIIMTSLKTQEQIITINNNELDHNLTLT